MAATVAATLEVIDVAGRTLRSERVVLSPGQAHKLSGGYMRATGIYVLRLTSAEVSYARRILVR